MPSHVGVQRSAKKPKHMDKTQGSELLCPCPLLKATTTQAGTQALCAGGSPSFMPHFSPSASLFGDYNTSNEHQRFLSQIRAPGNAHQQSSPPTYFSYH